MLLFALACTPDGADRADTADAQPMVTILCPAEEDVVTAGSVAFSAVVDNFNLVDPKHSAEGEVASGFIRVSVDGAEVDRLALTQFHVELEAGARVVQLQLFYDDGDAVEPGAVDSVTLDVQ